MIRAFARELDITAGYEIELEHEAVLSDAVDSLLADVSSDSKLLDWISSYVASRLDDSKGWDIRKEDHGGGLTDIQGGLQATERG
ncbi:MAG: hypothetical protein R2758_15850 [Bacteroidales bacterium]